MSEFKFTKGPWRVNQYGTETTRYHVETVDKSTRNTYICEVGGGHQDIAEVYQNALLIASAPELLEALQNVRQFIDNIQVNCAAGEDQLEFLKATSDSAINKALNI